MIKKNHKPLLKKVKRHFLLLEVLIAFFLVVLCALPLITPHVAIYRDQMQFVDKIDLDHIVNELYASVVEQLYRNAIPWNALEAGAKFPVEKNQMTSLNKRPLPYEGYYSFKEVKHKPKEVKPFTLYLYKLTFNFKTGPKSKQQERTYEYDLFIPRQLPGETPEKPDEKKNTEPKKEAKT